ncbi:MAG: EVE domain-containing protein [Candidatus Marinimicrobia bacterium]|nr:EVE domain-containing protein [Candidatus Neomarinimicrobiota bacterium]MCF7851162.1 EVE domain-containing protein [Candidatus Neomarinimicrobiota bacterium]MCF7905491.1 EVE domain-containing protein [Candidatus Neomarinimicrobiota bacterium]
MAGWLIISSEQNLGITARLEFKYQGLKHRHRKKAMKVAPGDVFFYYITGEQKLAAMTRIRSFVEEGSEKIWVNLGKDPNEHYPWRFEMEPLVVLDKSDWLPMENFSTSLIHFRKWPEKYWRLGLQGQIHALREEDMETLQTALRSAETP